MVWHLRKKKMKRGRKGKERKEKRSTVCLGGGGCCWQGGERRRKEVVDCLVKTRETRERERPIQLLRLQSDQVNRSSFVRPSRSADQTHCPLGHALAGGAGRSGAGGGQAGQEEVLGGRGCGRGRRGAGHCSCCLQDEIQNW